MSEGQNHSEFDFALAKVPAPSQSTPLEVELIETLLDCGCAIPDGGAAIAAIEKILDRIGDERAAAALGIVFARLPGGKHGMELRAAMNLSLGCDGAELARKNGETKQGWSQRVERLRCRIFKKR